MSANIVIWKRSPEEEAAFIQYQYDEHVRRSKHRGDYHAIAAQALTGLGDYWEGDMGEPPRGSK